MDARIHFLTPAYTDIYQVPISRKPRYQSPTSSKPKYRIPLSSKHTYIEFLPPCVCVYIYIHHNQTSNSNFQKTQISSLYLQQTQVLRSHLQQTQARFLRARRTSEQAAAPARKSVVSRRRVPASRSAVGQEECGQQTPCRSAVGPTPPNYTVSYVQDVNPSFFYFVVRLHFSRL